MEAILDVRALLPEKKVKSEDILELVGAFASTWFSLDAHDKEKFPKKTYSKKGVEITVEDLQNVLQGFKEELKKKNKCRNFLAKKEQEQ